MGDGEPRGIKNQFTRLTCHVTATGTVDSGGLMVVAGGQGGSIGSAPGRGDSAPARWGQGR